MSFAVDLGCPLGPMAMGDVPDELQDDYSEHFPLHAVPEGMTAAEYAEWVKSTLAHTAAECIVFHLVHDEVTRRTYAIPTEDTQEELPGDALGYTGTYMTK